MTAYLHMDLAEMMKAAGDKRRQLGHNTLERCAIMSAKSGKCGEDCAYCAQSSFHNSKSPAHPLKSVNEMVNAAHVAFKNGATHFGIVTSGNALSDGELDAVAKAVAQITAALPLKVCASLGALSTAKLFMLRRAGLSRYHHNIETAPSHYAAIVSTHGFKDRLATIANVKAAGLELCCGGILGLGESWSQRVEFARAVNNIAPQSVPLNFLIPVKGTRLYGKVAPLTAPEALRCIALLRLEIDAGSIRLCAGRESVLGLHQLKAFKAGASGLMLGGYLTVKNHNFEHDRALMEKVRQTWLKEAA